MKTSLRALLLVFGIAALGHLARAADTLFITNPSGPDTISTGDVKAILLGNKTKWNTGGIVKLAVLDSGATHEAVIQEFTARSADQFEKFWKKQVFTGKGVAPDVFKTDAEMVDFVARTPGAFGYISPATATNGVKVLTVQ